MRELFPLIFVCLFLLFEREDRKRLKFGRQWSRRLHTRMDKKTFPDDQLTWFASWRTMLLCLLQTLVVFLSRHEASSRNACRLIFVLIKQ